MPNMYRKKLDKIYNKIDKISLKGRDNKLEYFKYISELVDKGDYSAFEETLLIYYNFNVIGEKDIESYKEDSWNIICQNTKTTFLTKLSRIYKRKGIYQSSFDIYIDSTSQLLGQIYEREELSNESKYYIKNKQFSRLIGERKTYLEVKKVTENQSIFIENDNLLLTEENNLLNRYELAIDYLLHGHQ
jgi:uncharacterized protein with PIN domain